MSDIREFNWTKDEDAVVVPRVDAIAVYLSSGGQIVIRQEGPFGDEDSIVSFPIDYAEKLIAAIRRAEECAQPKLHTVLEIE